MTTKDDGGPAFPESCTSEGYRANVYSGMTLRDWFAGQALAGMCAYSGRAESDVILSRILSRVQNAYAHADAMLAERSK